MQPSVIASTRGNVTTILLWALWLVVPLGLLLDAGSTDLYQPNVHRQPPGRRAGFAARPAGKGHAVRRVYHVFLLSIPEDSPDMPAIRAPHACGELDHFRSPGYVLLCAAFVLSRATPTSAGQPYVGNQSPHVGLLFTRRMVWTFTRLEDWLYR